MVLPFKNMFGAAGAQFDLQRQDLFMLEIPLPAVVNVSWANAVMFAVEKFPFPDRSIETVGVKFMQQTNYIFGADTPTGPVDVPIRYAFAQPTALALERWFTLVRNQKTGGVGLPSFLKTDGRFYWLIPDEAAQSADVSLTGASGNTAFKVGLTYVLEGCFIKGLKHTEADHTQSGKVDLTMSLQMDRFYPADQNLSTAGMVFTTPVLNSAIT